MAFLYAAPSPPLNLRTQDVTSISVTVIWDPPQNPNGRLQGYKVSYTPSGGRLSSVDAKNNTSWKLTKNEAVIQHFSKSKDYSRIWGRKYSSHCYYSRKWYVSIIPLQRINETRIIHVHFLNHKFLAVLSPPLNLKAQNVTSTSVTIT